MKFLKLAVISVVVLFGVITLISLLLPSHIRISRAIDITAPREKIYGQMALPGQWENWNEYIRSYHHRQVTGNEFYSDEMNISLTRSADSLVESTWYNNSGARFGSGYLLIGHGSGHYTVQWYFDFHLRWYPWEKFQSIVYDQQFGPVMEKSLGNLKHVAENAQ